MGTMARTAVVAGTATAVHGAMTGRSQARAQAAAANQQAQIDAAVDERMAQTQPAPQQQPYAPPPPPTPGAPAGDDVVSKLRDLADMKAQGLISDEEFAALKAQLLA